MASARHGKGKTEKRAQLWGGVETEVVHASKQANKHMGRTQAGATVHALTGGPFQRSSMSQRRLVKRRRTIVWGLAASFADAMTAGACREISNLHQGSRHWGRWAAGPLDSP